MKVVLIPRPGRTVLMPGSNRPMQPAGEEVDWNAYWQRRYLAGDVTRSQPNTGTAAPAAAPAPTKPKV